jgi:hypothetical protein
MLHLNDCCGVESGQSTHLPRHVHRGGSTRRGECTDRGCRQGRAPATLGPVPVFGPDPAVMSKSVHPTSLARRPWQKTDSTSPFVFVSERGGPLSPDMIARIVERAGEAAKVRFHVGIVRIPRI